MSFPDFTQNQPSTQFPDFTFDNPTSPPLTSPQDENTFPSQQPSDQSFPFTMPQQQTDNQSNNNNTSPNLYDNAFSLDTEEQSRISQRQVEEEQRMQLIRKKMELELTLKNQNREKANQYINDFQR
jgi:hypothetical protein